MSIHTPAGWWNAPIRFFALRVVDAGLAADGRIDHRQQRGRHHDERQAAVVRRGGEPREVADHAAADRDHAVSAGPPRVRTARRTARELRLRPRLFPGRHGREPGAEAGGSQGRFDAGPCAAVFVSATTRASCPLSAPARRERPEAAGSAVRSRCRRTAARGSRGRLAW